MWWHINWRKVKDRNENGLWTVTMFEDRSEEQKEIDTEMNIVFTIVLIIMGIAYFVTRCNV